MAQIRFRNVSPQQVTLEFNGALIGTLILAKKGNGLTLLAPPSPRKKKPKRKKFDSPSAIQERELLVKANQLGKAWRAARCKWHASQGRRFQKEPNNLPFMTSELRALKRAVHIMQSCGVSNFQTYIKAQVVGLKFCNAGKGIFPNISHLISDGAELRLLTYLKAEKDDDGNPLDIEITAEERNTPLTGNLKYMALRDAVMNGKATRAEALYVMTLQVHRTGAVKQYVTDYIEQLNKAEVES